MPASQPANFNLQEFSDAGLLLFGGRLYTYAYGTTAQKTAYTDPAGAVPHTYTADGAGGQYIALNARAELPAPLYLAAGAYDITLKRQDGSTVWTRRADPTGDGPAAAAAALTAPTGAGMVGWIQSAVGAVSQLVLNVLRERMSISNFLPTGYVTDGSVDYTVQLQAAFDAAKLKGAVLFGIEGTFQVTGTGLSVTGPFKFRGTGMDSCVIKNNNGNVLRVTGQAVDFSDVSLWSVSGGHTVVQSGILYQCNWTRHRVRQDALTYSCWDNAGFEYVDNRQTKFDFIHALGATVHGVNLVAAGGLINDNEFLHGRATNSGTQFFSVRSNSANFQYANSFKKITFEVCRGGGIDMQAAMLFLIEDCHNWDCGANAITDHFYKLAMNASNYPSVGIIRNCGRWAGSNMANIYDVQLPGGGGGAGIEVSYCATSGGGDPFMVDCNNNGVLIQVSTPSVMSTVNGDGALVMSPADAKPGFKWGIGLANLYRSALDTLKTDGSLIINTNLVAGAPGPYGATHTIRKNSSTAAAMQVLNGHATPQAGIGITYDGASPNSTTSQFLVCGDTGATRAEIRSNGGFANFSANNVNLSDGRLKTDIVPALSYWNKIKAVQIVTYRYKDQTDPGLNLGVIAQQLQSVAPELVDPSGYGEPPADGVPYLAVYQTDIEFAAIKALQEAMARIEALEARIP